MILGPMTRREDHAHYEAKTQSGDRLTFRELAWRVRRRNLACIRGRVQAASEIARIAKRCSRHRARLVQDDAIERLFSLRPHRSTEQVTKVQLKMGKGVWSDPRITNGRMITCSKS